MKIQYRYDSPGFNYQEVEKEQSTKKERVVVYQESNEVRNEHIYQQVMNDMYEKIDDGECFNIKFVERTLMKNILSKYNRTQSAKMLGFCVRTLRNKINEYGLKDIRINSSGMH